MKRILPVVLVSLTLATVAPAGRAAWGWPPPGYSAAGLRACDGRQYRGLRAWLRDRRHGVDPAGAPTTQILFDAGAGSPQGQPGGPELLQPTPQPPIQMGAPNP